MIKSKEKKDSEIIIIAMTMVRCQAMATELQFPDYRGVTPRNVDMTDGVMARRVIVDKWMDPRFEMRWLNRISGYLEAWKKQF